MLGFVLRRLLTMIPVLLIVVMLTFVVVRIAPGGPFDRDRKLPAAIEKNLKAKYNLDAPIPRQFLTYLGWMVRGDLGPSTKYRDRTVNEIIAQTFPVSLLIGGVAFLLASVWGIFLGTFAAMRRHSWLEHATMMAAMVAICVPLFVVAPVCILIVGFQWRWFPVAGWGTWRHVVLPALLLALPYAAYVARLTRNSLIETLQQDYIRTAIAKGVSRREAVLRHALKISLLPVVSFLGPMGAEVLTGSIVLEQIFNIPGMGTFFVNAVFDRDVNVVVGITLVFSVLLLLFNLIVDVAYQFLDPRIRSFS
ncbi:MAG: ABC transporter permease subunit [Verrucomicrobiae bacterium]|nr:ABC transporter permease subunit [Verrucomicrobiae bacterium]